MKRFIYGLIGVAWVISLLSNFFEADAAQDGGQLFQRACIGCHGESGTSTEMGIPNALKGQSADALYKKMLGYKAGTFGGSRRNVMQSAVKSYSEEQIRALADSVAKL